MAEPAEEANQRTLEQVASTLEAPPAAAVPPRQRMTTREWLGIVLSVVAVVTSVGTAYFTTIRQLDILRMDVNAAPTLSMDRTTSRMAVKGELSFFLINAGNRPAVISRVLLKIGDIDRDGNCKGTQLVADMDAFVVSSQDIVAKRVRFRPPPSPSEVRVEDDLLTFPDKTAPTSKSSGAMCVSVEFITPSHSGETRSVSLITYSFEKDGAGSVSRVTRDAPATIWRESSSILGD